MKLLFMTDCHWSQHSSIVRSRGEKYSIRLENLVQSINWVEQLAWQCGCGAIVCGGDFFDSAMLNSEEVSALKEIQWAPITHMFITGNHETTVRSLDYSTADLFALCKNSIVISKPESYRFEGTDVELCFLPYIFEKDRQPIDYYFPKPTTKRILFSHNDLKDVQYGPFISTEGFTISDIESNCDLCLNGHIHHCGYVSERIINGGNLTGQNFTEDAYKFEHCVQLIDTDTLHVDFYRNPHAFNFYKLDCSNDTFDQILTKLSKLSTNAVITIKVNESVVQQVKEHLGKAPKELIVEYRVIVEYTASELSTEAIVMEGVDHLKQFENYVLTTIGTSELIKDELQCVMR